MALSVEALAVLTEPLSDFPSMSLAMVGRCDRVSSAPRYLEGTRHEVPATRSYIYMQGQRLK